MILIYSDKLTPRLRYTAKLIFEGILKSPVSLTDDAGEFAKSEGPKINYSDQKSSDELYLKPKPLLSIKEIIAPEIDPVYYEGEKYFFATSPDSVLPFDPFAASFFVVSRMEEYLEPGGGKYSCFPPEKSILAKYGLLKKPVVNIWANILAGKIKEHYPDFEFPKSRFNYISTIDIDNAWAFKHKGFVRGAGAFLKDLATLRWQNNWQRIGVWFDSQPDPYDSYNFLDEIFRGNEGKVIFFFLLGDRHTYDKSIPFKNKHFRKLIGGISKKYEAGMHPSFFSSQKGKENMVVAEKQRLENITGKTIKNSRQHFLRLFFPGSYRTLIKQGIVNDFTMGYSSQTGFRAGICTPYPFFDLEADKEANLTIYPFQVMDVTLRDYLGMNPDQAQSEILQLMEEVKKVGGTFISIWHNESLHEKGWREVFKNTNETGFKWANEPTLL
jgi:hypothetical protein